MRQPIGIISSIAVSSEVAYGTVIDLIKTRRFTLTGQCIFGTDPDGNVKFNIYYSPDGKNWDTEAYGSVELTAVSATKVQKTAYVIVPEHGHFMIKAENVATDVAATAVKAWFTIQDWTWPEMTRR